MNPLWIQGLLPETNSLIFFFHQREYRVCFFQTSMTLVGIRVLNYPSLMSNRHDGSHHNDDNEVEDIVPTRAKFYQFREKIQ